MRTINVELDSEHEEKQIQERLKEVKQNILVAIYISYLHFLCILHMRMGLKVYELKLFHIKHCWKQQLAPYSSPNPRGVTEAKQQHVHRIQIR